jgi:hypothetical protein
MFRVRVPLIMISSQIQNQIRKNFGMWGAIHEEKKTKGSKSRTTVPLKSRNFQSCHSNDFPPMGWLYCG